MPAPHRPRPGLIVSVSLALGLALACGGSKPAGPGPEEKQAAAKKADDDAKEAAAMAERKAKREAEQKAAADAEQKVTGELERLSAALPAKLPKDPVAACEAVGQAQDAFVRRLGDAKAVAAWDAGGKDKAIPMTIVQCTQADSVKTAACQKHILDNAGPELKDETRKIMQICIDKYGSTRKPPAGMPQKRPG
jgi:hypothetical protein